MKMILHRSFRVRTCRQLLIGSLTFDQIKESRGLENITGESEVRDLLCFEPPKA
ncbi:hypothetical protein KFK09_008067 [Dendrobium nobile]|uniref:Uncharacterized protein n=1 Tax=Dendrobium nobile TaxID=94219 RepID=A0A8T3BY97_DENNO|nr:hypothetical protein KFK09_008067 [Dendrobium nobile]